MREMITMRDTLIRRKLKSHIMHFNIECMKYIGCKIEHPQLKEFKDHTRAHIRVQKCKVLTRKKKIVKWM